MPDNNSVNGGGSNESSLILSRSQTNPGYSRINLIYIKDYLGHKQIPIIWGLFWFYKWTNTRGHLGVTGINRFLETVLHVPCQNSLYIHATSKVKYGDKHWNSKDSERQWKHYVVHFHCVVQSKINLVVVMHPIVTCTMSACTKERIFITTFRFCVWCDNFSIPTVKKEKY